LFLRCLYAKIGLLKDYKLWCCYSRWGAQDGKITQICAEGW
jgi:hypothetical protein